MKFCLRCQSPFGSEHWTCPVCGFSVEKLGGHLAFAPEKAHENAGFQPEIFAELAELEARNFWFRARNRMIVWAMRKYFPRVSSFMEIGCGTGFVLSGIAKSFPSVRLYGSEIFSDGLGFAASRLQADAELFQMDARHIPFKNEFDVIGAFDVLEHIQKDETVLSQMYQATSNGGGIILTVPQHEFLWSQQDTYACHVRRYEVGDIRDKVARAGFVIERVTSFVSFPLPLMYLSRRRKRFGDEKFDPLNELRLRGLVNAVLEAALDLERVFIRLGVSFPMGGSLLLIARKT